MGDKHVFILEIMKQYYFFNNKMHESRNILYDHTKSEGNKCVATYNMSFISLIDIFSNSFNFQVLQTLILTQVYIHVECVPIHAKSLTKSIYTVCVLLNNYVFYYTLVWTIGLVTKLTYKIMNYMNRSNLNKYMMKCY